MSARTLKKRDTKSELLAEVDEYERKANIEIHQLEQHGLKDIANILRKEMNEVTAIAKELKATTTVAEAKKLENKLESALGPFKAMVKMNMWTHKHINTRILTLF